ncbi:GNAT family N-acetyltransferase [Hymenobacter jeollabukensis]|uniref:GNAT family N-acetyltransferase n=1 Tax=Hymenobacter jeollabukensis TaxID=2025313 RepID=A0A5R8WL56_9BACT|nr:GNAT family N-acetyltransferase [Hymenobacter jeollabukensis]TLM89405.1 GNAT family N-acetyltransferase [Hymenobacter jeollabukensis]
MTTLDTPRLLLRPFTAADAPGILALDSDPAVLRYVPMPPMTSLEQAAKVVDYILAQYARNGLGRWVVERKEDGAFLGWCGLKYVDDATTNGRINYHDLGYRLLPRHWGQGYASEAAAASLRHGFDTLKLPELHATVMQGNVASQRVVERLGFGRTAEFEQDGATWYWYERRNNAGAPGASGQ